MQRVRVGLTGLAAIFLLVMIAAASLKPVRQVAQPKGQAETLAVLGVAPSSGAAEPVHQQQQAVAPAVAPARKPDRT
jgi:hypothetical protein